MHEIFFDFVFPLVKINPIKFHFILTIYKLIVDIIYIEITDKAN